MGIEYSAMLIVGRPYAELKEKLSPEKLKRLDEMLDLGEIEYASPYFDAPRKAWVVGLVAGQSGDYSYSLMSETVLGDDFEDEVKEFEAFIGMEPKAYISVHGT